jgi:hypothetical protein
MIDALVQVRVEHVILYNINVLEKQEQTNIKSNRWKEMIKISELETIRII